MFILYLSGTQLAQTLLERLCSTPKMACFYLQRQASHAFSMQLQSAGIGPVTYASAMGKGLISLSSLSLPVVSETLGKVQRDLFHSCSSSHNYYVIICNLAEFVYVAPPLKLSPISNCNHKYM